MRVREHIKVRMGERVTRVRVRARLSRQQDRKTNAPSQNKGKEAESSAMVLHPLGEAGVGGGGGGVDDEQAK